MGKKDHRYDEIEDIRKDVESLRKNIAMLSKAVRKDVSEGANEQIHYFGERGRQMTDQLETKVKEHPGQYMLAAFAGGLVTSALLSRR
jgi:ElaB/YqjD/DUF883 family membrane-anchored ribosome-binding protein